MPLSAEAWPQFCLFFREPRRCVKDSDGAIFVKHHVIALAISAMLLAACSDEPRGPLEVQNKTMLLSGDVLVKFEFTDRKKGQVTLLETGEAQTFEYTLDGDQLVVRIARPGGDKVDEMKLVRDGQRFEAEDSHFVLSELTPEMEKRWADQAAQKKEAERKAKELAEKLKPQGAPADAAAYTLLDDIGDEGNDWGAWVALAWSTEPQNDDELLRMLSRPWNNTRDSFERQALRGPELERIQQRLAEVRKIAYVRIPWSLEMTGLYMDIKQPSGAEAYDFDKKSFHLSGNMCERENRESTHSNVRYVVKHDAAFCWLPVPDEAQARSIEAARSNNRQGVHVRTEVFAKIAQVKGFEITLVPVALEMPVHLGNRYQRKPGELLAQVSLWPYR